MHGLFPLSAYSPNKDAQTGAKRRGERPQEPAKASTQNRANTPKSLTAQMEPRYYGQVPFRGCSLMVKPQSSKLITRVRFPSSPRDLGSRRFRVEALSFSLEGMTGIPSACGFVSSRARNPHAPARHPLAQIPPTLSGGFFVLGDAGNRFRAKIHSLARPGFSPSSPSSPRELVSGIRLRMQIYFLARSESAHSRSSSPP